MKNTPLGTNLHNLEMQPGQAVCSLAAPVHLRSSPTGRKICRVEDAFW